MANTLEITNNNNCDTSSDTANTIHTFTANLPSSNPRWRT